MKNLIFIGIGFVLLSVASWFLRRDQIALVAGDVYSVDRGDGTFGIVKLLVLTDGVAHIRIYANVFDARPDDVDLDALTLTSADDPDNAGFGHLPLEEKDFRAWSPVLIAETDIAEEELEGYEVWKDADDADLPLEQCE